jgi:drug/metabolite transporter (DMT)-like permease
MSVYQSGILVALATTLSWSIGIFPFTEAARRLGVNSLNHFRLLLAAMLLLVASVCIDLHDFLQIFTGDYQKAWIWLGLSGLVGLALGDYFAFKMYAILGARTGSMLTTFSPAAALICGQLLLGEKINGIGVAGIIMTILGVISISLGKKERSKIPLNTHGHIQEGIIHGILGALCQGVGLVLAKKGFLMQEQAGHLLNPIHATFIRMLISVLILFLFTLLSGKMSEVMSPVLSNREQGIRFAVAGTFFGPFLGVCLSLLTITMIDVAVAQTIFSLVPVMALFIARIFLNEKISAQSVAGVFIANAGVMILIWRAQIMNFISG